MNDLMFVLIREGNSYELPWEEAIRQWASTSTDLPSWKM